MDFLSQQFNSLLRKLSNQLQEIREAIDRHAESQHQKNESIPVINAELKIPESLVAYKYARDEKADEREGTRTWVEYFTLFAILIYAGVSILQWHEMRKATEAATKSADTAATAYQDSKNSFERTIREMQGQTDAQVGAANTAAESLKAAEDNFTKQQRPYLVFSPPAFDPTSLPIAEGNNAPIYVKMRLTNIGRSPAIKVNNFEDFLPFRANPKMPEANIQFLHAWFADYEKRFKERDAFIAQSKIKDIIRQDMAPSDYIWGSLFMQMKLLHQDYLELHSGQFEFYFIGMARYTDAFGRRYETQYCSYFWGDHPEAWRLCATNNWIK